MFAYCRNNPIRRIDISGTADVDCYDDDAFDQEDLLRLDGGGGNSGFDAHQAILDGRFAGGYNYGGRNYNLLSNSISTGRSQATNLNEQIAMKASRTNPQLGRKIIGDLGDRRLVGFFKYTQYYKLDDGGIEVHYVGNPSTNTFGDFKFK